VVLTVLFLAYYSGKKVMQSLDIFSINSIIIIRAAGSALSSLLLLFTGEN
jgi:hypothetical protein